MNCSSLQLSDAQTFYPCNSYHYWGFIRFQLVEYKVFLSIDPTFYTYTLRSILTNLPLIHNIDIYTYDGCQIDMLLGTRDRPPKKVKPIKKELNYCQSVTTTSLIV